AGRDRGRVDRVVEGRTVEDVYPLSPMQLGMLFHTLRAPASAPYHEQGAYDIEGPLDATALRRAWEAVVARHAILRSRFAWEGLDRPQQIVEHAVALPWDEEDWSPLAADEERRLLAEGLAEDKGRGFALGSAPLMRLRLCRLAASRSLLVWSFHHALLDGWSVPLLWAEVWERYRSLRDGAPTTSDAPF